MLRVLRRRMRRNRGNAHVKVEKRKLANVAETLGRYGEAVAFAEAGMQDEAQRIIRQESQERRKILVVGLGDNFSRRLIDYSVGSAKRMGYEIVALNCVPVSQEALEVPGPHQEKLCEDMECRMTSAADRLTSRAAEEGVPCQHVVKLGPPGRCIRDLQEKVRRIEFVLTEPEASPEESRDLAIPVFCLAE